MKVHGQKVSDGQERNAHWRSLTPQQQWDELDRRLGKGIGARRQRTKLSAILMREDPSNPQNDPEVAVLASKKGKQHRGQ
jgi:hypothetical protein